LFTSIHLRAATTAVVVSVEVAEVEADVVADDV
jgi:hypothetical protein